MPWSPTIRAALLAGTPWLDVFCPGCGHQQGDPFADHRSSPAGFYRHPGARPAVLQGSAPMSKLIGLFAMARRAQNA
jgi:hypothetical protein